MVKYLKIISVLLFLMVFTGCSNAENSAPPKSSTDLVTSEDLCNIGINTVNESDRTNYTCSPKKGCQWLSLGGKQERYYACCPTNLNEFPQEVIQETYSRCIQRID